jgi:hypothetical protein
MQMLQIALFLVFVTGILVLIVRNGRRRTTHHEGPLQRR